MKIVVIVLKKKTKLTRKAKFGFLVILYYFFLVFHNEKVTDLFNSLFSKGLGDGEGSLPDSNLGETDFIEIQRDKDILLRKNVNSGIIPLGTESKAKLTLDHLTAQIWLIRNYRVLCVDPSLRQHMEPEILESGVIGDNLAYGFIVSKNAFAYESTLTYYLQVY